MGKIPSGWQVGTVGNDYNLTMGQSPPGRTYNEEGAGIPFFQGKTDFGFRYPTNRVYCTEPTRFANPSDTLVSVRAPVGDINIALERCSVGRGVAALRHKTGSRSFTYYQMMDLRPEFEKFEAVGTVFGSINKKGFESLQVVSPPTELIKAFEGIAYPVDQKIQTNEQEGVTLANIRDLLLPKLMAGELEINQL